MRGKEWKGKRDWGIYGYVLVVYGCINPWEKGEGMRMNNK